MKRSKTQSKEKTKQLIEEILEEGAFKVEITPTEVSVFMYAPINHAHFNWQHCELELVLKDVLKWVKETNL